VTIIGAENIVSTQSTDNGTIEENGNVIPSIGMVGTVVAISAGFFIAIRREDEE
jgi:flagellar motor component MotA